MKKIYFKFLMPAMLLAIFLAFNACSKDDGDSRTAPTVITLAPSDNSAGSIILGGNVTNSGGGDQGVTRGVCWGTTVDPVLGTTNYQYDGDSTTGIYYLQVFGLQQNQLYYARAFAVNEIGVSYGASISFTLAEFITTVRATNIQTRSATLNGIINAAPSETSLVGVVYSTTQNPDINDGHDLAEVDGSTDYSLTVNGLTPNTVYYFRSCVENVDGSYTYGAQMQFRTTGYVGPAGGYVAYDKGELTDGWRYLEIHQASIPYGTSTQVQWGPTGSIVSGLLNEVGSGVDNTNIIASTISQANCAAKLCQNLVRGGYSDWFLPSSAELLLISNSLHKAGIDIGDYAWTSNQINVYYAVSNEYVNSVTGYVANSDYYKNSPLYVYPVRRY